MSKASSRKADTALGPKRQKPAKSICHVKFPLKLHQLLDDAENQGNEDIVGWSPDGLSFKIHKQKEFVNRIMPRYFRHSNFRSFQRQLYHYNFIRVPTGELRGAYKNPVFSKGNKYRYPNFQPREKADGHIKDEDERSNLDSDRSSCPSTMFTSRSHPSEKILASILRFDSKIRNIVYKTTNDRTDKVPNLMSTQPLQRISKTSTIASPSTELTSTLGGDEILSDIDIADFEKTNLPKMETLVGSVDDLLATLRNGPSSDLFLTKLDLALEPTPLPEVTLQTK